MMPSATSSTKDYAAAGPLVPVPARIRRVQRENGESFTLSLDVPQGVSSFHFEPGQFNMLYAFGIGEAAISISGDPADATKILHTIREVGTVTHALSQLKRGDVVGIRGPYGTPWPLAQAAGRDLLVIAGGVGLAPLRPTLLHVLKHRRKYGRVALVYGARSPENLLYQRELERWQRESALQTLITVDRADASWHGHVGVVTALLRRANFDPKQVTALMCGPEVMMRYAVRELAKLEVREKDIYLSLERSMKCGIGFCGHCQYGPYFLCRQGPVLRYDAIRWLFSVREV